jgi:flagellar biosynthesis protein FlhA
LRMHIRKFTERFLPDLAIISHSEISPSVQIKTIGVVDLNAN